MEKQPNQPELNYYRILHWHGKLTA